MLFEIFILCVLIAFAIGLIAAYLIKKFGKRLSLIDAPNERSAYRHKEPTPRGGGLGIWLVSILGSILIVKNFYFAIIFFLLGAVAVVDDRYTLSVKIRLIFQFILSLAIILIGLKLELSIIFILLIIFWIIFICSTTNFYNFMDGIDGIAGATGVICFSFLAFYAHYFGEEQQIALFCACMAASCLGFLIINFSKSRVFMGDIGSTTLGFVFAVIVMLLSNNLIEFICLASFIFTFYADEIITLFIRIKKKENITQAHRQHLYQLLANEKKIKHWKVTTIYIIVQFIVGATAVLIKPLGATIVLETLIIFFLMILIMNLQLRNNLQKTN